MAIITLLTDNGKTDHYIAAIKAKILSFNTGIKIIDISHEIDLFDIGHGAFMLNSVFRDFPKSSIHLIGINATDRAHISYVAVQIEGHFFVCANNGFLGLITDRPHQYAVEIGHINTPASSSFPEKDILAPAAARLANGVSITDLGKVINSFEKKRYPKVKITKKEIAGHVIRVDHYGNLIANISKNNFDGVEEKNDFVIYFGRERISRIHSHYTQVQEGDCFVIFNSQNLLEIGINKGRANELLGLQNGNSIHIKFNDSA